MQLCTYVYAGARACVCVCICTQYIRLNARAFQMKFVRRLSTKDAEAV